VFSIYYLLAKKPITQPQVSHGRVV